MLVALDLTARQSARVLAQALRTHAKLEIEPRPEHCTMPLWGTLELREQDRLQVSLLGTGPDAPLTSLIGAMCDARTILSEQLYLFSTYIVEATDDTAPLRLKLAAPDAIQVANRRRFARKTPTEPVPVRLTLPGWPEARVGTLTNVAANGLGCRLPRRDFDPVLFIGDELELEFVLPWTDHVYALPATICNKTPCHDLEYMNVGFEFVTSKNAATRANVDLLRAALQTETARLTELEGD